MKKKQEMRENEQNLYLKDLKKRVRGMRKAQLFALESSLSLLASIYLPWKLNLIRKRGGREKQGGRVPFEEDKL